LSLALLIKRDIVSLVSVLMYFGGVSRLQLNAKGVAFTITINLKTAALGTAALGSTPLGRSLVDWPLARSLLNQLLDHSLAWYLLEHLLRRSFSFVNQSLGALREKRRRNIDFFDSTPNWYHDFLYSTAAQKALYS
jgi:hypothetical protein